MRKTLWIALSLALLAAAAAFAVPAASSPALQPAVSSPAPAPSGLPPGALPMTRVCPVGDFCVWAKCECDNQCIRQHVPGTLTSCFPSTSTYTCTCQLN